MLGVHSTNVRDMHVDYIVPSENGNRTETRWVALQDEEGAGLAFVAAPGETFDFGCHNYSIRELDGANEARQLSPARAGGDQVYLTIDTKHMGVGGDDSWSPSVHEAYRLPAGKYCWSHRLVPLPAGTAKEDLPARLREAQEGSEGHVKAAFDPMGRGGAARHLPAILVAILAVVAGSHAMQAYLGLS